MIKKFVIAILFLMMAYRSSHGNTNIKEPNVAGQFYSADSRQLSSQIDLFLSHAAIPVQKDLKIIIVPHAGYVYSGPVAAFSFKAASENPFKTIVILAPSHYYPFDGISVWKEGGFRTPLGVVEVDQEFSGKLLASNPDFKFDPGVYEQEHSLEVELPFLQKTFKDFKIVPVLMGQPDFAGCRQVAKALKEIIGDRSDVLIVVSSDMSHYHDDTQARKMDGLTLSLIKSMQIEKLWQGFTSRVIEMCGSIPVTTALLYAREQGMKDVEIFTYANSGDASGDKSRVVGYSAIGILGGSTEKSETDQGVVALTQEQKKRLLSIARETIEKFVRTGKAPDFKEKDERLQMVEGAFVTIRKKGALRGCIGNIIGQGPLYQTIRDMAVASASRDPRFSPVTPEELSELEVEVSVLSKPRVVKDANEIEMGKHGVIVSHGPLKQGVFLPKVADETGWIREEFLANLCAQKAGLPADAWKDPKTTLEVFTAQDFSESELNKQ